jgi:4-hydroxybenzoate polyprenyltransferase
MASWNNTGGTTGLHTAYSSLPYGLPYGGGVGAGLGLQGLGLPDPVLVATFAAGGFVMRGAGCTVNDLLDRKIDALVERTKDRPLASGKMTVPQGEGAGRPL